MKSLKLNLLLVFVFALGSFGLKAQTSCTPKDCIPANCTPAECLEICKKICQGDQADVEKIDFSLVSLVDEGKVSAKKANCQPVCGLKSANATTEKAKQVKLVKEQQSKTRSCQPSNCLKASKSGV